MKLFTYYPPVFILSILAIVLASCEKETITAEEWGARAEAKFTEIQSLTGNIPCAQQDQVSIEAIQTGCITQFFPVTASNENTFTRLKNEYLDLLGKTYQAEVDKGIIIEPCPDIIWTNAQPIRLDCNNGHVQVITAENIPLEEAKSLTDELYPRIVQFMDEVTCTDSQYLAYTALFKEKYGDVEYLPYSRKMISSEMRAIISNYNHLKSRLIEASGDTDYVRMEKYVSEIECVDGKPVIRFEER